MKDLTIKSMLLVSLFMLCTNAFAGVVSGYGLNVLVNGDPRTEYHSRDSVYVEAIRGKEFSIRLTNPTPYRVAVALSVDGLNTIDAKHTTAWNASKWVLEPYESTVISGWQVNGSSARRFFFTGEKQSYGAALGQTANLGVIEAVYYRERQPSVSYYNRQWDQEPSSGTRGGKDSFGYSEQPRPVPPAARSEAAPPPEPKLSDDYAATGMGRRTRHEVENVDIDLDPQPVASMRIRYEFHQQLVKLGVLPVSPRPIERREQARGFGNYCPEPD
ncbi:MAG TPA: hypothetical protein VEZ11_04160 [Thermoanaerobaculia bacterium]|nr:hypothetical protein [Thermoanaerobaculia bacterium]